MMPIRSCTLSRQDQLQKATMNPIEVMAKDMDIRENDQYGVTVEDLL